MLVSCHAIRIVARLGKDRDMMAKCGHEDMLGYLTNTPCLKCVKAEHAKVMGKG